MNDEYLTALLSEKEKLKPFLEALPICAKLLEREIAGGGSSGSSHEYQEPLNILAHEVPGIFFLRALPIFCVCVYDDKNQIQDATGRAIYEFACVHVCYRRVHAAHASHSWDPWAS